MSYIYIFSFFTSLVEANLGVMGACLDFIVVKMCVNLSSICYGRMEYANAEKYTIQGTALQQGNFFF
jgi:hypothetical protein